MVGDIPQAGIEISQGMGQARGDTSLGRAGGSKGAHQTAGGAAQAKADRGEAGGGGGGIRGSGAGKKLRNIAFIGQ